LPVLGVAQQRPNHPQAEELDMCPAKLTRALLKIAAAFVLLACTAVTGAHAGEVTFKVKRTVKLDAVGNADVRMQVAAPTNVYTTLKTRNPNIAVLMRKLGAGRAWNIVENVDGSFNDMQSTIDIHYTERGVARIERDNKWTIPFGSDAPPELVDLHDTIAIWEEASNTELGLATMILRVECPAGSTNLKNDTSARCFSYDFQPQLAVTGKAGATFGVDNKDAIMSCLAKCYSNEKFSNLWAARSRFDNTGSTLLSDYRVRFRIAGFTAWSPWRHTSKIYPGQVVVDPYYPVFDFEKLNGVTGPRPAMLETEYEYSRPDGQKVAESDSRKLDILGYNETIFSGLPLSEIMNFADRMEYMPAVLASFTTSSDPVIQQLAGRVSGRAGGAAAAAHNEDAVKFLRAFNDFLAQNKVAYQTPPSFVHGEQFGQHIKYGRDVLHNHAGTCIDLAILWASTCEAVGLRPVLVVIPSHCFPAVYLPEGQLVAIESTAVGHVPFEKVIELGTQDLQKAQQGDSIIVDISSMRKAGIQSLDLPAISSTFLADEGYRFDAQPQRVVSQEGDNGQTQAQAAPSIIGVWEYQGPTPVGNVDVGLALKEDGRMGFAIIMQADGQQKQFKSSGTWRVTDNTLVTSDQTGTKSFQFQFRGGQLSVYCPGLQTWVNFHRVQTNS
jgi:hypothetical protein